MKCNPDISVVFTTFNENVKSTHCLTVSRVRNCMALPLRSLCLMLLAMKKLALNQGLDSFPTDWYFLRIRSSEQNR